MAHYARINSDNIVEEVIVADHEYIVTLDNPSSWIQTSYNTASGQHTMNGTPLRKNYAGVGFTYDPTKDAFIPPKPFEHWVLDESTCTWFDPISK